MISRSEAVEVARSFIGTKYVLGGRLKDAGVDCATLLACYATEIQLADPGELGVYSTDWFCHASEERYMFQILRHARKTIEGKCRGTVDAKPGSLILFKVVRSRLFNHGGIITQWPYMVHAVKPCVEEADATKHQMTGFTEMAIFDPWGN